MISDLFKAAAWRPFTTFAKLYQTRLTERGATAHKIVALAGHQLWKKSRDTLVLLESRNLQTL